MSNLVRCFKILVFVLLLAVVVLPMKVEAQDLEPRRWGHLPIGMNSVGISYIYTDAFVYFSPFLKITNTRARINSYAVSAIHNFDLAGKSARISFLLPFVSGRWDGDVDDQYEVVHRNGFADPKIRFSVSLYGAPLAVSVPLGQYDEDELINISNNRWTVRPQVGVVHSRGHWSFELTGSAFLFSDNKNFIDNTRLEQRTMYAA